MLSEAEMRKWRASDVEASRFGNELRQGMIAICEYADTKVDDSTDSLRA